MKQTKHRLTIKQIIKEEVKKHKSKKLKEGLMTKMFDYIDAVTTKGKLDYAAKKINKENPELAKSVSKFKDATAHLTDEISNMSDDEKQKLYDYMDKLGI